MYLIGFARGNIRYKHLHRLYVTILSNCKYGASYKGSIEIKIIKLKIGK